MELRVALPDITTVTVRVKKNSTTDQVYQVSYFLLCSGLFFSPDWKINVIQARTQAQRCPLDSRVQVGTSAASQRAGMLASSDLAPC